MKYRLLGNSGLRVSQAALGAMTFGEDCPHAITWTHADEVNRELANFLGKVSAKKVALGRKG